MRIAMVLPSCSRRGPCSCSASADFSRRPSAKQLLVSVLGQGGSAPGVWRPVSARASPLNVASRRNPVAPHLHHERRWQRVLDGHEGSSTKADDLHCWQSGQVAAVGRAALIIRRSEIHVTVATSRHPPGPCYQSDEMIASTVMKQLLLRVPDEVHRRLTARAARDGRSVNSVATEILDAAADADEGDRRERLRARAATLGILRATPAKPVTAARHRRVIASTRGIGPVLDQLLAEERERA